MHTPFQLRQRASAEVPQSRYVPLGSYLSHDVIRLRQNGDVLATWRLDGISFETADPHYIADRKRTLHNFWNSLGGGEVAVWAHKVRRAVHVELDELPDNPFARHFTQRYHANLAGDANTCRTPQMVTELYLTLIHRVPHHRSLSLRRRFNRLSLDELIARQCASLSAIDALGERLVSSLSAYRPVRLGVSRHGSQLCSDQASFYSYLLNGVWEHVPFHDACLADFLPVSRLHFGDSNGMLEIWHPQATRFAGLLDIQDYPRWSEPGMNNAILYSDYEYIETQSFSMLGKRDALDALAHQRGHLIAAEDPSHDEIEHMDTALSEVNSGDIQIGEYHYSLAVLGDTPALVRHHMAQARAALQDGPGLKLAVVDVIPECAWFAQLPGNWHLRPRQASISSKNFCNLASLHNFSQGKRTGNPWGNALALMQTSGGQPFFFNHHVSPEDEDSGDDKKPGNTTVIGPTGTGKTSLLTGLLLLALKYRNLRGMFFDKDRGAEICIRRLGANGHYCALKRGEPTGFSPLQLPTTEVHIAYCERWLKMLAGAPQPAQRTEEEQDISHAVRTVMSDAIPPPLRRLSTVWQNLRVRPGGNSLRDRLHKWTAGQRLGWAFDNPEHTHNFDLPHVRIYGYDYTEFLDDEELCAPTVDLLLHLSGGLIDGRPFIYWMEEFWKALMSQHFADFALNKQKTIRKQNGLGVFSTQSPSDVLQHKLSKTIVEQSVTKIFLPNPSADHDDYVLGFKLSEQEFDLIRNMDEDSRLLLVKQGHQSAILRYDLSGMPDLLNILSGSLDNVQLLDQIRSEVGDDPALWEPILQQRIAERRAKVVNREQTP